MRKGCGSYSLFKKGHAGRSFPVPLFTIFRFSCPKDSNHPDALKQREDEYTAPRRQAASANRMERTSVVLQGDVTQNYAPTPSRGSPSSHQTGRAVVSASKVLFTPTARRPSAQARGIGHREPQDVKRETERDAVDSVPQRKPGAPLSNQGSPDSNLAPEKQLATGRHRAPPAASQVENVFVSDHDSTSAEAVPIEYGDSNNTSSAEPQGSMRANVAEESRSSSETDVRQPAVALDRAPRHVDTTPSVHGRSLRWVISAVHVGI